MQHCYCTVLYCTYLLQFCVEAVQAQKKDRIRRQGKGRRICLGDRILAALAVLPRSIWNKRSSSTVYSISVYGYVHQPKSYINWHLSKQIKQIFAEIIPFDVIIFDNKDRQHQDILISVADPDPDPHRSAFKKSSRIRIRMDRFGSGSRR